MTVKTRTFVPEAQPERGARVSGPPPRTWCKRRSTGSTGAGTLSDTANALAYVRSSVGGLSVDVLWSNASGSVLIGVIPDSGAGRAGVISGNDFTPLPLPGAASAAFESGTW